MHIEKNQIASTFQLIQQNICDNLERIDGKSKFIADTWKRPGGGGGVSKIIQHGNIIEKGGVNFSAVYGELPAVLKNEFGHNANNFFATGVSIVLHPYNPFVPIIHMNVRYFEMDSGTYWFGGGIDLTPHYIDKKQAALFHLHLKKTCDKHHKNYYSEFKKWADEYFFIKHRNETRGIGGIFFDHLSENNEKNKNQLFDFVCEVAHTFIPAYEEQVKLNKYQSFTEANKLWQLIRRGRYVEFNLVYDRGTKFGLETSGRTESILMSLPETACWKYNYTTQPNSPEHETMQLLKKYIDWISFV